MKPSDYVKMKTKILMKFKDLDDDFTDMENRIAEDFLIKSCDTKITSSKVSTAKTAA
jgi:hypothetical protein